MNITVIRIFYFNKSSLRAKSFRCSNIMHALRSWFSLWPRICRVSILSISSAGWYRVLGIRYHRYYEQRYRYRLLTWYRSILDPGFSAICVTLLFLMVNFFVKQLEIQQTIKITTKRKYPNLSIKNGDLNRWAVGLVAASFSNVKVLA